MENCGTRGWLRAYDWLMHDLLIAAVIMITLAIVCWLAGFHIGRSASRWVVLLWMGVAGLQLFAYLYWLRDNPRLTQWLPYSSVVILANWLAPAAAFVAGLTWRRIPGSARRKLLTLGTLVILALSNTIKPLHGSPPDCLDLWVNDVCIQTSSSTCSAAAAATLLRHHGIAATEAEMAELCLTREDGTLAHGLYRGLKLKVKATEYDVEMFEGTLSDLIQRSKNGPVVLTVRLDERADVDPRYAGRWGWIPGQSHSVVLMKFLSGDNVMIADPSAGLEIWSLAAIRDLWHGEGVRLVARD